MGATTRGSNVNVPVEAGTPPIVKDRVTMRLDERGAKS